MRRGCLGDPPVHVSDAIIEMITPYSSLQRRGTTQPQDPISKLCYSATSMIPTPNDKFSAALHDIDLSNDTILPNRIYSVEVCM